ncbi:hypothetical protein AB0I77_13240 [Streptomyces sp. NPDC050619]|uniref:hypothetical protein n=1 Tax=Streptomyces sp. NPDC050619 TaxID=3157214 RepID=UPI00341B1331
MGTVNHVHDPNVSPQATLRAVAGGQAVRREAGQMTSDPEAGVLVHTRVDDELDVTNWLLQAADDPARARAEWQSMDVALLRCGVHFSAIRVSADVVVAAARSEDRAGVDEYLAAALHGGPVFVDRQSGRYYFLVPSSACATWRVPGMACLVADSFLGVPHPSIGSSRYLARSSWCVPMDRPGTLCQSGAVAQMVAMGRFLLAGAKETDDA